MMEYKGYSSIIEYDDEAKLFHGDVININDVITFQGTSVAELEKEMALSINDYLDWCQERGEEPNKPFSGRFVLRTSPELHKEISTEAKKQNKSINSLVVETLEKSLV